MVKRVETFVRSYSSDGGDRNKEDDIVEFLEKKCIGIQVTGGSSGSLSRGSFIYHALDFISAIRVDAEWKDTKSYQRRVVFETMPRFASSNHTAEIYNFLISKGYTKQSS